MNPPDLPVIGITCSRMVGGAWGAYSRAHFMNYTYSEYCRAVSGCGGAAVLLPVELRQNALGAVLNRLDGIILSGGPDVHPRFYGEQPIPQLGEIDEPLDRMELETAKRAVEMDLPLLGICRGIQIFNVAMGGAIYQDISSQVEGPLHHFPSMDKSVHAHTVAVEDGTLLSRIVKRKTFWVNSKHHQAVKRLGKGLTVSAHSPDGLVEALELSARRFALAVQWHPEGSWESDRCARAIFKALVQAARENAHPDLTPGGDV